MSRQGGGVKDHTFNIDLTWNPLNLKFTYKEYSRLYTIRCQGKPDFIGTAAPEYLGSKYHYNPEEMLIMSLSACHMLSYLAFASNSKVGVLSYRDKAKGILQQEDKIIRFKEVTLYPHMTISKDSNLERAESLHEKAHHACFIANSVNFPVKIEPTIKIGTEPYNNAA